MTKIAPMIIALEVPKLVLRVCEKVIPPEKKPPNN